MTRPNLRVGGYVFFYDVNRRVYAERHSGFSTGAPIFRGSFCRLAIVGETKVSWIVGDVWFGGRTINKMPKRGPWPYLGAFYPDVESVNDACWVAANRVAIIDTVRRCTDADKLRAVAALLALPETPETPLPSRHKDETQV